MTATPTRYVGERLKRREDPALITGAGRFIDDIQLPGMTQAAILHSPHAHARRSAPTDAAGYGRVKESNARTPVDILGPRRGCAPLSSGGSDGTDT